MTKGRGINRNEVERGREANSEMERINEDALS